MHECVMRLWVSMPQFADQNMSGASNFHVGVRTSTVCKHAETKDDCLTNSYNWAGIPSKLLVVVLAITFWVILMSTHGRRTAIAWIPMHVHGQLLSPSALCFTSLTRFHLA